MGEIYLVTRSAQAQSTTREVAGTLVDVKGLVRVKRSSINRYIPVAVGSQLYYEDLLLTSRSTRAVVRCSSDGQIWRIPPGVVSGIANGCPRKKPNMLSPR
ncbi:MAG: hypothetical protein F6K41_40210 [Symploca sp. SIO3E6]|nr:hypothetical protein [Caldora sp. SIO3E6]